MTEQRPAPDPWSVVEHHARAAAVRGDGALTAGQRLAMYVTAAPAVVGARSQGGRWVIDPRNGGPLLAIDESGEAWVQVRSDARRVVAFAIAFVVSTMLFSRVAGPRGLIAGLVVAAGAYALSGTLMSRWRRVGTRAGDHAYEAAVADLVATYERPVGGGS